MSIEVALADLADEISRRGPGYLLTSRGDGRPHVLHERVLTNGMSLSSGVSRSAAANIAARPEVTLLWPPEEPGGYSLIVDAEATLDGERATIEPQRAVLHRRA